MGETIALGSDHGALENKERVREILAKNGLTVQDFGTNSTDSCDYPTIAQPLAKAVQAGQPARGILLCGTGLGMCYAANRYSGVRAALCWSKDTAALAREHNDSNILVLPGRVATLDSLEDILQTWLETPFSNEARHQRRLALIDAAP